MYRWKTGKDGIILINYFYLKFKEQVDHWKNFQNDLSGAVMKKICSKIFLQIIINTSVAEFIFSKIACFQHILVNTFRLNYEHCSLRSILFYTLKQHSDYKSFIAWIFDGNTLKMKAVHDI